MVSASRILTIAVVVLAAVAASAFGYFQFLATANSYASEVKVSFTKSAGVYDYSCNEEDYQIHFMIANLGSKNIADLSASITNPLCVEGIPALPNILNASSKFDFYAQSTSQNGTLTLSGNNTFIQIKF